MRLVLRAVVLLLTLTGTAAAQSDDASFPLVDLLTVDSTFVIDMRYATEDNFTGAVLDGYHANRAFLLPEVAAALADVQADVRKEGLGLKIFDAYRPVRATLAMVEWARRTNNLWAFEAGYIASRSRHNEGTTVDLTLIDLATGQELDMGTPYDTFSEKAHTANASDEVLANRLTLKNAMQRAGFSPYSKEWWHFSRPTGERVRYDLPIRPETADSTAGGD